MGNLVETVKGYMKHERETLEAVISARNRARSVEQRVAENPGDAAGMRELLAAEQTLTGSLGRLFALSEGYPDLKANQNMQQLQEELASTENRVAFARQAYNDSVMSYNTYRESFPHNQIAGAFGFKQAELGAQVALVGLALLLIGYVGVFFANLIKAAVSRQREFLADASAVQFTRNPAGIAGALEKIGGFATGSRMVTARADEASHMFFGDGKVHRITAAMATHPPLTERIRRVDPSFEGRFSVLAESYVAPTEEELTAPAAALASPGYARGPASALAGAAGLAEAPGARAAADVVAAPPPRPAPSPARTGTALDRIGQPGPEHLERARALWDSAPAPLREAARTPEGATALAYALLTAPPGPERERQRAVVREDDLDAAPAVDTLLDACGQLEPDARLPVLEVAAAALGTLPPERFAAFSRTVRDLVEGDRRVELSEWLLARLLLRQVSARLEPAKPAKPRYRSVRAFVGETAVLLSALAHAGHDDPSSTERAFDAAARELRLPGARLCGPEACAPRALEAALETFALLFPEEKRRLLSACAASVAADRRVLPREAELFRVVSDWLGVPVPPLLPGQLLA